MHQAYVLAEEVGDAARAKETTFGGFAALVLARACQSVHSANILASNGLIGDAMAVARTPVELAIDVAYIAKQPDDRIRVFMDHDRVKKLEMALAISDLHDGDVDAGALAELTRRADAAKGRNPALAESWTKGGPWAGVSIKARAKEGDRVTMYKLLYRDMCDASHAGYGTLEYALVDLGDDPKIRYGNMEPDEGPAILAVGALLAIVATVVDASSLDPTFGKRSTELVFALVGKQPDDAAQPGGG